MSKKQMAYSVQRMKGIHPAQATVISGTSTSNASLLEKKPIMKLSNASIVDKMREFWWKAIEEPTQEPIKWADKLRASDLLAHHVGMFEASTSGNTYNTIIMADNKSSDEATLMKKLQALQNNGLDKPQTPSNDAQ